MLSQVEPSGGSLGVAVMVLVHCVSESMVTVGFSFADVPCIFSGDQIGMLDPHQTLFGPHESGQC